MYFLCVNYATTTSPVFCISHSICVIFSLLVSNPCGDNCQPTENACWNFLRNPLRKMLLHRQPRHRFNYLIQTHNTNIKAYLTVDQGSQDRRCLEGLWGFERKIGERDWREKKKQGSSDFLIADNYVWTLEWRMRVGYFIYSFCGGGFSSFLFLFYPWTLALRLMKR